eukprot:GHUV01038684.1.p2 GENE.GHUV01038684.1~~GHUV01038684.1.p2  ORF type:complete len:102 (-),score=4.44 GHUV01038684.1:565-870(-)
MTLTGTSSRVFAGMYGTQVVLRARAVALVGGSEIATSTAWAALLKAPLRLLCRIERYWIAYTAVRDVMGSLLLQVSSLPLLLPKVAERVQQHVPGLPAAIR